MSSLLNSDSETSTVPFNNIHLPNAPFNQLTKVMKGNCVGNVVHNATYSHRGSRVRDLDCLLKKKKVSNGVMFQQSGP